MKYNTKEVAEKVGRAVRTVQITIKKLNIPTTKEGRNILIDEDGLATLLNHFQSIDKKYTNKYAINFDEVQSENISICNEEYQEETNDFKSFIEEIYNENKSNTITVWIYNLSRVKNYIKCAL